MNSNRFILLITLSFLLLRCSEPAEQSTTAAERPREAADHEAISFDGRKLFPPPETTATKAKKDSLLVIAQNNFNAAPDSLNNIIWLGRRLAYLSRYREAIAVYTAGIDKHPGAPELYRHRGHRYISTRQLDLAIADFEKAAALAEGRAIEIEPDGLPNKLNIPLSSLQFNIWYHWALAYYLKGDLEQAASLYEACMRYSTNPDLLAATSDWLYMTYRRLGEDGKAAEVLEAITPDLKIIENASYFNRLLMYKGLKKAEDLLDLNNTDPEHLLDIVTQGYGVGNWHLYQGDTTMAKQIFEQILATSYWSAFGYIAAEADLSRMKGE